MSAQALTWGLVIVLAAVLGGIALSTHWLADRVWVWRTRRRLAQERARAEAEARRERELRAIHRLTAVDRAVARRHGGYDDAA